MKDHSPARLVEAGPTVMRPDEIEARSTSARGRALRRFRRHRLAMFGVATILLLVLASAVGPSLIPFNDLFIDLRGRFAPPLSGGHLLGTDPLGRDLLARLLMAGRISLAVGFAAMLLSTAVG